MKQVTINFIYIPWCEKKLSKYNNFGNWLNNDLKINKINVYRNKWDLFKPKTNIYWLHYVLDKMLTSVHYKNSKQSIQKSGLDNLKMLKDAILSFNSAKHFAESDLILNFVKWF